ncbi:ATP-grasp fold amidoligase family protein [Enterobacter hormaechei]|nr:glycosyltransferase [Enterobacter hormaechei]
MYSFLKGFVPDSLVIIRRSKKFAGTFRNLITPKTFNDKVAHRMLNPKEGYALLSDKYRVRDVVARSVGEEYLIPLLWHGKAITKEIWDSLPDSFALKANHASGTNLIVKDKSEHNFEEVQKLTQSWMELDFGRLNLERHYSQIDRLLIAEELLLAEDGSVPSDYKVHCFFSKDGCQEFIQVDHDRFGDHKRDVFDSKWNLMPMEIAHDNTGCDIPKPENLDKLLELSRTLAKDLGYARVDWYIIGEKFYFGEITLTHGCACEYFVPRSKDMEWGRMWDMSLEKSK